VAFTLNLFHRALGAVEGFGSPRAWAFAQIGIHAYLRRFAGDSEVRRIRATLAERLFAMFRKTDDPEWPWFEDDLTYANARVPHALLLSGQWMYRPEMIETSLRALDWLARIQTSPQGHFVPVGNDGWHGRGRAKARFDQQPIEAQAMIDASIEAFNVTRDERWRQLAVMCLEWFLGRNDLRASLYDHATGGCRDGLYPEGVNQNEGAESTLAWLSSLLAMQAAGASSPAAEVLAKTPVEQSQEEKPEAPNPKSEVISKHE
jgi:hypothetical protein